MRPRFLAALALAAILSGCDSGDPVTPQIDVDAALAQMTLGAGAFGEYGMGGVGPTLTPATNAASCAFDAGTGFFICPGVTSNGITFTRQFQLLDASGAPLATIDPLLVASIRSVSDLEGTVTPSAEVPISIQIERHDDATLSGLQSANRLLDATATQLVTASTSTEGSSVSLNDTTVTTQLQLPSTPQQKYPLGGTIVSSGTIYGDPNPPQSYRVEMAFDGTSFLTIKAMVAGETWTCKVNMASPNSEPTCG